MTTFSRSLSALVVVFGLGTLAACEQNDSVEDAGATSSETMESVDEGPESTETMEGMDTMDSPGDEMQGQEAE